MNRFCLWAVVVQLLVSHLPAFSSPPGLPSAAPEDVGLSGPRLAKIDAAVATALAEKQMPGCVVLVGRQGKIVFLQAYGQRSLLPVKAPMTTDTLFDLASLTKPIATAAAVMKLAERGEISLEDPISKHLPEFAQAGKEKITIRDLLLHQGGLIADNALRDYSAGAEAAWKNIYALKPLSPPGERFIYSDVGFLVLARLVEKVAKKDIHEFTREEIFLPLGMTETSYLPEENLRARAAPTQQRENRWMQGEVHDPRAYKLGGIAGHAGLFSTAADLARFAQMMLGEGEYQGVRVLKKETVAAMTAPQEGPGGLRGLGWDIRSGYSSNRGEGFSKRAFGHGGFTGTSIWIDPELDLFVIFLSNRVHPDGKGSVNRLAGRIGTIAAEAVSPKE